MVWTPPLIHPVPICNIEVQPISTVPAGPNPPPEPEPEEPVLPEIEVCE